MNPRPGEVWLADLGWAAKFRPIVIVSRHDPDAPRSLIIYVPITTQYRQSAYEVMLPRRRGFVLFQRDPMRDVSYRISRVTADGSVYTIGPR